MNNEKKVKAYLIDKDSYYSTIRVVEVSANLVDDATYYKTLSKAKKDLISDLKYQILMYKDCIDSIKSMK